MTRAYRLLLIGQLAATLVFAADPLRTVILVRHAERGPGIDAQVPLLEAGNVVVRRVERSFEKHGEREVFRIDTEEA